MKPPTGFKADNGQQFSIKIRKTNIRSYWIELIGTHRVIKVKKRSKKLMWEN